MKPPILWSDFTYNSPQEKIFWEKAPDWSGIKGITSWFDDLTSSWPATIVINGAISRRDSNGSIIGKDSVQGYTGWAKSINFESKSIVDDYHHRTIYKLENGWVVKSMSWNIVGQKREEATFKDGWPSGSYILWHDNGRKKEESRWMWKDGQPFSIPVTAWYENGQKRGEAIYVWESYSEQDRRYRIMRDGLSTSYYENGQKKSEITFRDGEKNGLFTWYRNGRKSWEGRYKNGKWDGLYNEWYENGQKEKESTYKDGKLMTAVAWKFNGEKCPATKVVNGNGVVVVYRDDGTVRHHLTYKHGKDITSPSPVLPAPRKRKRPPLID